MITNKFSKYKKSLIVAVFLISFFFIIICIVLRRFEIPSIIKKDFDKEIAMQNYEAFCDEVNYGLYRQGNPEQVYMAENPDLPFSEIETFISIINIDNALAKVKNSTDIEVEYLPMENCQVIHSEQEILIKSNDDKKSVTFYFTDINSADYPDIGNAVVSHCQNISMVIFQINDDLFCTVVGRNISYSEVFKTAQSITTNA